MEAALLFALIWTSGYREYPVFTCFIAIDWARSVPLFAVWLIGFPGLLVSWGGFPAGSFISWVSGRNDYPLGFMILEPPDMIALCAAGIEAFGREVGLRSRWPGYVAILGFALVMGYGLPPVKDLPLNRMFMQRSLITFTVCGALISAAGWHAKWPSFHAGVLFVFCLFDLITYFSLALYPEWGKTHPIEAPLLVLSGQTACLSAWAVRYSAKFH